MIRPVLKTHNDLCCKVMIIRDNDKLRIVTCYRYYQGKDM